MKIYKIDSNKSKIQWSSNVGKIEISGKMDAYDGILITELGELIEGNVRVDLGSLKVLNSPLDDEKLEKLREHLKSIPLFDSDDAMANYKIQKIIPDIKEKTIKGMLTFGDLGFGMDVQANIEHSEKELIAHGKMQASRSNFVFLEELEKLYAERLGDDKSISTFKINCDIIATTE